MKLVNILLNILVITISFPIWAYHVAVKGGKIVSDNILDRFTK